MPSAKSIAVFLGANDGNDPKFGKMAQEVASLFVENHWKLVYGGSSRGLMGILGKTAASAGVQVHGIKPRPFLKYEKNGLLPDFGINELVEDLHTQKRRMAELTDAFIVLPGGFGTLEELVAIRMWSKLGVWRKPILLLNFDGFYDQLLGWISVSIEEGFISKGSASTITVVDSVKDLSEAVRDSSLRLELKNDDSFDWPILAPAQGTDLLAFEIADKVARQYSLTTQWSTWHTWDYLRMGKHMVEPVEEHIWENTAPYATCVGLTFPVAMELRESYTATLGLETYAAKVETLASSERDLLGVDRPFHCLVAVCLENFSVVIDLTFSPVAFVVPINGFYEALPYIGTSGHQSQRLFRYSIDPTGKKGLTMERVGIEDSASRFAKIDHARALQQISIAAAKETVQGTSIPTKKVIIVRKLVRGQPVKIPGVKMNAGWMITSCRLQINFWDKNLTLQIPLVDWLLKPNNAQYLSIQKSSIYRKIDDAVANLVVDLHFPQTSRQVTEDLESFIEIGEKLGLLRSDLLQCANSIYEVWKDCVC